MVPSDSFCHCASADAYIFDIDGTLLVTRDRVHYDALNQAMRQVYGADTTIDGVPYHGMTDLSILRGSLELAGISRQQFENALPGALALVRRQVEKNAARLNPEVCPGIPALLRKLQAKNKGLGVASGNLESVGWRKLEAAGLREFFTFGCFSDRWERRAEIFQNAVFEARARWGREIGICFVGDTPADIEAARAAQAAIISVCTGSHTRAELEGLSPDLCVGTCAE